MRSQPQMKRYILIEVRGFGETPVDRPVDLCVTFLRRAIHDTAKRYNMDTADIVISGDRPYYTGQPAEKDYAVLIEMFARIMGWAKAKARERS